MSTSRNSSNSTSRTCPACGARNSGISLFCAECGATLNVERDESGDTAPFATTPGENGSQRTETFQPIRDRADNDFRWDDEADRRPDETAPLPVSRASAGTSSVTGEAWNAPAAGETAAVPSAPTGYDDPHPQITMVASTGGGRGFALGLLATLLIAAVVGLYGWSAWLSDDVRDTISGWFGFIG